MPTTRTAKISGLHHIVAALFALSAACALFVGMARADASAFIGTYSGSAEVTSLDGTKIPRDMSVEISETSDGFRVQWTSVTYRTDGEVREKSYEIDFVDSGRGAVFAAAQRKNVFGHEVQLDPMKGEPYVWSRIVGETLTVYSLFVGADGGYSLQQYDRTLADGGLDLRFQTIRDGEIQRAVETFLARE
ncbi:hypothetical protein [uncultured Tateyamaria sp.]|uniref:hypothetical protein n=1 Tax=uncultured Tateyamaria sp. TaxID=455651 RepID=UPI002613E4E1|nr:hypothetical protein [uncultured Tateyamaria sp.]